MTNLSATPGQFENPNMANVIDALKRLERIGSEHSETTRKIIEAASELSDKIAGLYPDKIGDAVEIVNNRRPKRTQFEGGPLGGFTEEYADLNGVASPANPHFHYSLEERKGKMALCNSALNKFVDEDRAAALRLAEDIAAGLLDYIEIDLQNRATKDIETLKKLQSASAQVRLGKRLVASVRDGAQMFDGRDIEYEITGLPESERAFIAEFHGRWKILRVKGDVQGDWAGDYASADEAKNAIESELKTSQPR